MTETPTVTVQIKNAANAKHAFPLLVRDRVHFYKVVNWLNQSVGKGSMKWTMAGRVLNKLKMGKEVTTKVYIFVDDFDESSILYLSLI